MKYFFVFQNKTFYEEFHGGYLWAPQSSNDGKKAAHWEKMKEVRRGDVIIHSYRKKIMAVSFVERDVYVAKRPEELPDDQWQMDGWRVDTDYISFTDTIITSDYKEELLKLQPQKYAPFNRLGRGNMGYLFEANRSMFEFIIRQTALIQKSDIEKQRVLNLLDPREEVQSLVTDLESIMDLEETKAKQLSPENLAVQIKKGKSKETQKKESVVYYRNAYIKEMVKFLAKGKCQMCGDKAPFYDRDGKPYLEEHHVKRLADGGSDTMDNVVAVCPNCHRKVHILKDKKDLFLLEAVAKDNEKQYQRLLAYAEKTEL